MRAGVAIVGVGYAGFRTVTPELSWKELMYQAASRAYEDAGIAPRKDVDSFISCAEDYWEGFSIFDEFVPDQLGAVLRPTSTVCGDGIHGLAQAWMQICSGVADVAVVEAHSKASDILAYNHIVAFAMDPVFHRPLGTHPYAIAGLEMRRYLQGNVTPEQCASVVVKNKRNALRNPKAAYEARIEVEDVLQSPKVFSPLKKLEISQLVDGCVVMVLANAKRARELTDKAVWIKGIGWASETPWLESRDWNKAVYAELAARDAYKLADITSPHNDIEFAEVDDKFAYKELQHLEALRLAQGDVGKLIESGAMEKDGILPVNVSGGSLGVGNLLEASGLHRTLEVVLQLRGEAGPYQLSDVTTGLAQSWRGIPTTSGGVIILSTEGGTR